MIVTTFDVSSLSQSLHRWEIAEYIFEGLVIVACAGELVADLGRKCLKKPHRDRIQRLSTILLVVALSTELICLVKTNDLSGRVIGSLGDKAEKADAEAQSAIDKSSLAENKANAATADSSTALFQAKDALTKAGKAQDSLGKAEDEANKAQTASSNALALARGARQEADSFEQDIASAKKQATEAESHLADALQRAANAEREALEATRELLKLKTPRSLSAVQQERIKSKIKPFPEIPFDLWVSTDSDSATLMEIIDATLRSAGWKFMPTGNPIVFDGKAGVFVSIGISIHVAEEHRGEWESAIIALRDALIAEGIPATGVADTTDTEKDKPRDRIHVMIGSKRLD